MSNLLIQLHKLYSRKDENFLTEAFAHLVSHLLHFEKALALDLLRLLTGGRISDAVLSSDFSITTQITTEEGRPDVELRSAECAVYIEIKDEAPPGKTQMDRYKKALASSGVSNTALTLLSRYLVDLSDYQVAPDCCLRWYELAEWLRNQTNEDRFCSEVSGYLANQFVEFLQQRNLTMEPFEPELISGITQLPKFLLLLDEASPKLPVRTQKVGSWSQIGILMRDDIGEYMLSYKVNSSNSLMFFTRTYSINASVPLPAIGKLVRSRKHKNVGWANYFYLDEDELDIKDAHVQLDKLKAFLNESLRTAQALQQWKPA